MERQCDNNKEWWERKTNDMESEEIGKRMEGRGHKQKRTKM